MIIDIATRLKEVRIRAGFSQRQVAKKLGISKTSISGYETGQFCPTVERVIEMAKIYRVSTDYLLAIEPRSMISADGLTQKQIEKIEYEVMQFRNLNQMMNEKNQQK